MRGRRTVGMLLLWVATVAGASTLTWGVISSVGARVGRPVVVASPDADVPSGAPARTIASWSGKAGRITASCDRQSISLVSAVPTVGFWAQVDERGPERLKVEFEATGPGDDDSRETRVLATCGDDGPVFLRA